jgi:hypothetical protein
MRSFSKKEDAAAVGIIQEILVVLYTVGAVVATYYASGSVLAAIAMWCLVARLNMGFYSKG